MVVGRAGIGLEEKGVDGNGAPGNGQVPGAVVVVDCVKLLARALYSIGGVAVAKHGGRGGRWDVVVG